MGVSSGSLATWHTVEVVVERCQISELRNMKVGRREILMWRFSTKWGKWKMTSRKVTATEWIVNENKLSQAPLVAWHVLSSIWVHFGTWGLIFLVKNQFSHIFPASAWSPYQSLFLRHEIEKRLRAVYIPTPGISFPAILEARVTNQAIRAGKGEF